MLLAGDQLVEGRLHHFGVVEESVEVVQEQECGAVAFGQGGQRPQGGQGIAGIGSGGAGGAGQAQTVGDIPDSQLPTLLAGMLDDFPLGLIGLVRLNPQAGASGMDIVGQLFNQRHEPSVPFDEGFRDGCC